MSYGGASAAQYALRFAERLESLVLLAPAATVLRPPAESLSASPAGYLRSPGRRDCGGFSGRIFADMARRQPAWIDSTIEELTLNMRNVQRHHAPMPPVLTDAEWESAPPYPVPGRRARGDLLGPEGGAPLE